MLLPVLRRRVVPVLAVVALQRDDLAHRVVAAAPRRQRARRHPDAVLVLAVILVGKSVREPLALESSLLLTLIPLISPLGWDYTLLMSVLAVTLIVIFVALSFESATGEGSKGT